MYRSWPYPTSAPSGTTKGTADDNPECTCEELVDSVDSGFSGRPEVLATVSAELVLGDGLLVGGLFLV